MTAEDALKLEPGGLVQLRENTAHIGGCFMVVCKVMPGGREVCGSIAVPSPVNVETSTIFVWASCEQIERVSSKALWGTGEAVDLLAKIEEQRAKLAEMARAKQQPSPSSGDEPPPGTLLN